MLDDAHQQLAAQDQQQQMQYHQSLIALQQGKQQLDAQNEQALNPLRQQLIQSQIQQVQTATQKTMLDIHNNEEDQTNKRAESFSKTTLEKAQANKLTNPDPLDPSVVAKNNAEALKNQADAAKTKATTPGFFDNMLDQLGKMADVFKSNSAASLATSQASEIVQKMGQARAADVAALLGDADPVKVQAAVNNKLIDQKTAQTILNQGPQEYAPMVTQTVGPVAGARFKDLEEQIKAYKAPSSKDGVALGSDSESLKQLYAEKAAILQKSLDIRDMRRADFSHAQETPIGKDGTPDVDKMTPYGLYKVPDSKGQMVPKYFIEGKLYDGRDPKTQAMLKDYGGH
jgi:hypothetical protein